MGLDGVCGGVCRGVAAPHAVCAAPTQPPPGLANGQWPPGCANSAMRSGSRDTIACARGGRKGRGRPRWRTADVGALGHTAGPPHAPHHIPGLTQVQSPAQPHSTPGRQGQHAAQPAGGQRCRTLCATRGARARPPHAAHHGGLEGPCLRWWRDARFGRGERAGVV